MTDKTTAPDAKESGHGCCGGDNSHTQSATEAATKRGLATNPASAQLEMASVDGCCGGGMAEAKPVIDVSVKAATTKGRGCGCGG